MMLGAVENGFSSSQIKQVFFQYFTVHFEGSAALTFVGKRFK